MTILNIRSLDPGTYNEVICYYMNGDSNSYLWDRLYINQEMECDKRILPEISQYNVN